MDPPRSTLITPPENLSLFKQAKAQVIRFNRHIGKHLIRTVFIIIVLFIIVNTFIFYNVDKNGWYNTEKTTLSDAFVNSIYFTSTTMTTIGYGDITPRTNGAKGFVVFMQLMTLFLGMRLFDTAIQMKV